MRRSVDERAATSAEAVGRTSDERPATSDAEAQAHPYAAVDVVVFTVDAGALKALVVKVREGPFAGQWAFPGGLVQMDESIDDAAVRELSAKTGLRGIYLEQLRTFGDPGRDQHARVVSTAYFALVPAKEMVSTFGHGIHSCPAARFSISATHASSAPGSRGA